MRLNRKMLLVCVLMTSLMMVGSLSGYWRLVVLQQRADELSNAAHEAIRATSNSVYYLHAIANKFVALTWEGNASKASLLTAQIREQTQYLKVSIASWENSVKISGQIQAGNGKGTAGEIYELSQITQLEENLAAFYQAGEESIQRLKKDHQAGHQVIDEKLIPQVNSLISQIQIQKLAEEEEFFALNKSLRTWLILNTLFSAMVTMLAFLLAVFFGFLFTKLLNKRLRNFTEAVDQFAAGDFKARLRVDTQDELAELGYSFNRMADQLQASRNYIDSIMSCMPSCLIVVNNQFEVTIINKSIRTGLGYRSSELVGKPFQVLLSPETVIDFSELKEKLHRRTAHIVDCVFMSRRGRRRTVLLSAALLKDHKNQELGVVFIAQDVTERKKHEEKLNLLNEQLMVTARQAGMAEVATSILHNVGNVLNSVNVSANLLNEKYETSKMTGLIKLAGLMKIEKEVLGDLLKTHPQGKYLPEYMIQLAQYWREEKKMIGDELSALTQNVQHIKDIISLQQSISKVGGFLELVSVPEVLENVIKLQTKGFEKYDITIERDYCLTEPLLIDKIRLQQVIVNLMENAKDALRESTQENKKITVVVKKAIIESEPFAQIEVIDNGVGIARDSFTKIFSYGFTTKETGHGFGLHTSAISLKEMGGSLVAHSEGMGKGARFTVSIPFKKEKMKESYHGGIDVSYIDRG